MLLSEPGNGSEPLEAPREEASPAGDAVRLPYPPVEGVELTKTALTVMGEFPPGGWVSAIRRLAPLERGSSWWLGDLLVFGEENNPHCHRTYAIAAKETGFSVGTLRNLAYVSRRIPPVERRSDLPWRAHRVVAPLVAEERRRWLARAAERGWTSDELARRINLGGDEDRDSGGEFPDLLGGDEPERCPKCGQVVPS